MRRQNGLARDHKRQDAPVVAVDFAGGRRRYRAAFANVEHARGSDCSSGRGVALDHGADQRLRGVALVFCEQRDVGRCQRHEQPHRTLRPQPRNWPPHQLNLVRLCSDSVQERDRIALRLHKQRVVEQLPSVVNFRDHDPAGVFHRLDRGGNVPGRRGFELPLHCTAFEPAAAETLGFAGGRPRKRAGQHIHRVAWRC